jgi:DNA polymerase
VEALVSAASLDFETSSLVDLNARGIYHYAPDPSTKVLMLGYAFDDETPEIWLPGQPFPERLAAHIREGGVLRAWNASFERLIWEYVLANDHPDIPVPRLEQWECTAARARAHGLPHSLDNCAKALEMPIAKSPEGKRLIDTYCVKGVQVMDIPEADRELFIEYCKQDVEVERMIGKVLRELDDDEWQDYLINEIINDRGLPIDTEFALAAQHYGEQVKRDANAKIRALTGGMVEKATSRKMRTVWLRERLTEEEFEIIESSFDEHHRAELAAVPGLHPDVQRFIELVEDAGGATMAKYANIHKRVIDGRLNGAFLFSGAGQTGRYSSYGVQVHNLTREVFEEPEPMIAAIKAHEPIEDPAEALRRLVRNTIYAPNGMSWGDFSNIEGRVAPWLEGTDLGRAKLEMFARGVDPYIANAAQMYRIPYEEVTPQQRQGGKTAELACFGADTQVLTDSGVKRIVDVTVNDKLWDGVEWVQHQGVISKGRRRVIDLCGLEVTPDHLIRTGQTWTQAQHIASNELFLTQALATGSENLPFWAQRKYGKVPRGLDTQESNALAEQNHILSTSTICSEASQHAVIHARKNKLGTRLSDFGSTQKRALMMNTGGDCSIGWRRARTDVQIPLMQRTATMVAAVFSYTILGLKIKQRFFDMFSRLKDGINRNSILTGLMSMGITSPAICGSSAKLGTKRIEEKSHLCKDESKNLKPVFDILNSGPRNRFTIICGSGPLLVHNCGFLGGAGAIISMAKNFKLSFTEDEAKALRDAWRNVNPWAKSFGAHLDAAVLRAVRMPGQWHEAGRVAYAYDGGDWLWCRLPSGRMLAYAKPRLEVVPTPWGDERAAVTVLWGARKPKRGKQWPRRALHAGLLLENITQATAACVLRFAIRQAHFMGLRVIGHVHDEIIVEGLVEEALRAAMTRLPDWTDGLDIPVKINDGQRYGK